MSLLPPFIFLVDTNVLYRLMMKLYILASLRCYQIRVAAGSISGRYRSEPTFSLRELLCCVSNACQRQSPFPFLFLLAFLQIVSKIMRGYLHGLWSNWKVAIMYTALPLGCLSTMSRRKEILVYVEFKRCGWRYLSGIHRVAGAFAVKTGRQRYQVLFWLWYILYLSSNRGPSFIK